MARFFAALFWPSVSNTPRQEMLGSGGAKRLGSTGAAGLGAWSFNEKGKKNQRIFGDIPSGKLTQLLKIAIYS